MRTLIFVLAVALSCTAPVCAETSTPVDTIESFFSWALVRRASASPLPKDQVQLAKWVSPDLSQLLDTARVTQLRCIRSAPSGEKPNLLEGDIFVGNEEGATEAAYQEPQQMGGKTSAAVDLVYVDKRWSKGDWRRAVAWRAEVTLALLDRRWYVEDISFGNGRSLRATLQSYNDDGARECTTQ